MGADAGRSSAAGIDRIMDQAQLRRRTGDESISMLVLPQGQREPLEQLAPQGKDIGVIA
jgi:hypothetical protein